MSIKKISTLLAAASMLVLSGCFGDAATSSADATVSITDLGVTAQDSVAAWTVTGVVEGSPSITSIEGTVLDDSSNEVSALMWDVGTLPADAESVDLDSDYVAEIVEDTAAFCNGTYTLQVIATAGEGDAAVSDTATVDFDVTDATECVNGELPVGTAVKTVDVELGSWKNATLGSSLDADAMVVMLSADAKANSDEVDIWYSNEADGSNVLYSPAQANTIGFASGFTTLNETQMAVVADVDFASIKTQEEIDALWTADVEAAADQLVRAQDGDVVIIKTNQGNYRLLSVVSGDGTDAGKLVAKGAIPEVAAPVAE